MLMKLIYVILVALSLTFCAMAVVAYQRGIEFPIFVTVFIFSILGVFLGLMRLIDIRKQVEVKKYHLLALFEIVRLIGIPLLIISILYFTIYLGSNIFIKVFEICVIPLLIYYYIKHIFRCIGYVREYKRTGHVTVNKNSL